MQSQGVFLWISDDQESRDPDLKRLREAIESEVKVLTLSEHELPAQLTGETAEKVGGAIITPVVHGPIRVARLLFQWLPGREVIFLAKRKDVKLRKRELNFAFLYGSHRTIDLTEIDEVLGAVRSLLPEAAQQRRLRTALSRINEHMIRPRSGGAHGGRLAISDRLLASILAQSPDSLLALDLDGYVLTFNSAAADIFSLHNAEGRHFDETDLARRLPDLKGLVQQAIKEERTAWQAMSAASEPDRPGIDLEVSATPVLDEQGVLIGITVLLRNVSRLKAAERNLLELNQSLERRVNQRTEELKELNKQMEGFLYSVAHDLRAPIRTILSFSGILKDDFGDDLSPDATNFIQRITQAAGRMDVLIRDLLAYSRVTKVELPVKPVDLNEVLATAQSVIMEQIQKKGATVSVQPGLPMVHAHRTTLEQAVINLLSNALEYAKPDEPPRIEVTLEQQENIARLWIKDEGIGIDPEYHDRIFGIFERVEAGTHSSGTGIGLAIVKRGIERQGGKVGLKSALGEGSRFWIELPIEAKCEI